MKSLTTDQKGFTILELLIATMVFSVIFLGATTALLQIGKLYYKGVVSGRTQETTRGIVDQISQQLQFSGDSPVPSVKHYNVKGRVGGMVFHSICTGNARYTYVVNARVDPGVSAGEFDASSNGLRHALWRDDNIAGCEPVDLSQAKPSADGEDMLIENMRLSDFTVGCNSDHICTLSVGLLYGANDLLTPDPKTATPTNCKTIVGSQWCAASQLTTTVLKRINP